METDAYQKSNLTLVGAVAFLMPVSARGQLSSMPKDYYNIFLLRISVLYY